MEDGDDGAFEYLAIRIEPEQYSGRPDEPSHYIHEVSGKVVLIDESDSVSKEVGEFACSLIDADAADLNGVSAVRRLRHDPGYLQRLRRTVQRAWGERPGEEGAWR